MRHCAGNKPQNTSLVHPFAEKSVTWVVHHETYADTPSGFGEFVIEKYVTIAELGI